MIWSWNTLLRRPARSYSLSAHQAATGNVVSIEKTKSLRHGQRAAYNTMRNQSHGLCLTCSSHLVRGPHFGHLCFIVNGMMTYFPWLYLVIMGSFTPAQSKTWPHGQKASWSHNLLHCERIDVAATMLRRPVPSKERVEPMGVCSGGAKQAFPLPGNWV